MFKLLPGFYLGWGLGANDAANVFGIEEPRVAILAAIELVNPAMPASVEAATLHMMCTRHQFSPRCIVEGPFAFDNAINEAAARHKNIAGPVAGKAAISMIGLSRSDPTTGEPFADDRTVRMEIERQAVASMAAEGASVQMIADELDLDDDVVRRRLRMRPPG